MLAVAMMEAFTRDDDTEAVVGALDAGTTMLGARQSAARDGRDDGIRARARTRVLERAVELRGAQTT